MVASRFVVVAMLAPLLLWAGAGPGDKEEYPKLAPFSGVRWRDEKIPEVKIDETWFELLAINDVKIEEILDFARQTYNEQWKKRFSEDLVELMSKMGHPTDHTANLTVKSLENGEVMTLENVPMTKENRRAIRQQRNEQEERKK